MLDSQNKPHFSSDPEDILRMAVFLNPNLPAFGEVDGLHNWWLAGYPLAKPYLVWWRRANAGRVYALSYKDRRIVEVTVADEGRAPSYAALFLRFCEALTSKPRELRRFVKAIVN
jgi:hypothetical protein